MTNDEIQNIFYLECDEALGQAEEGLLACQRGGSDPAAVNTIFRAVHSIKGGAGAFNFSALQAFTHKFETVLSYVRDANLLLDEDLNILLLRAVDVMADHIGAVRSGLETPDDVAMCAELERVAKEAEARISEASTDTAPTADKEKESESDDILGLDFDLDSLLDDLSAAPAAAPLIPDVDIFVSKTDDWILCFKPTDGALANGGEPLLLLRELRLLGGHCLAVDFEAVPSLDDFDAEKSYLSWRFGVPAMIEKSAIEEIFSFVQGDCELLFEESCHEACPTNSAAQLTVDKESADPIPLRQPLPPQTPAVDTATRRKADMAGQTIRVDLHKLDRLIDTVGELVIAQAMMAQRMGGHDVAAVDEIERLDQLTREIQESSMAIRAQPISSVFSRVPRIVRELEADTGKQVNLLMSGESTELDTTVIERLGEPLTHLIRNAIDHGIEHTDVRLAAGKSAKGNLHLAAEQRSGRIVISLSDDGKGIDRDAVMKRAVERALVKEGTQLSNEEIDSLILTPGFSTATTVSNVSGRGVGMDVVSQNVKELGGKVSIESRPGSGCTFTLTLPLTLAIADGMIVRVGDQTLVIPLTEVLESLRPVLGDCKAMGNGLTMLSNRDRFLPIIRLDRAVGAIGATQCESEAVLIIVESESCGQAALMVDDIIDQRQFVIKSLEANFQPVAGVAGATILGDGHVALILDVDAIIANGRGHTETFRVAA